MSLRGREYKLPWWDQNIFVAFKEKLKRETATREDILCREAEGQRQAKELLEDWNFKRLRSQENWTKEINRLPHGALPDKETLQKS